MIDNKYVAFIKNEKEPITEVFAMKAINEAFDEQEYENELTKVLDEYNLSAKAIVQ